MVGMIWGMNRAVSTAVRPCGVATTSTSITVSAPTPLLIMSVMHRRTDPPRFGEVPEHSGE